MNMLQPYKLMRLFGLIICSVVTLTSCKKYAGKTELELNTTKYEGEDSIISESVSSKIEEESIEVIEKETTDDKKQKNYAKIYKETGELPSLANEYKDYFKIGVALARHDITNASKAKLVSSQFNSITCENEMKADFKLDRDATLKLGDEECPVVNMKQADVALSFAYKNGLTMRGHTLVWHSQTPRWLFTVGFDNDPNAPFVTREIMLLRMENYIRQEIEYVNTNYPGVVYAWDVVNEAIEVNDGHELGYRINNNYWYKVIGEDFIEMAFTFARKYATADQKLFYNDYGTYEKSKLFAIYNMASKLKEKKIIDGIGMQDHIQIDYPTTLDYQYAIKKYAELDLEIQITELDIHIEDNSDEIQAKLATRYRTIMTVLKNFVDKDIADITSVTFWGLTDDRSWLNKSDKPSYPLLFNKDLTPKPAYFGVLQDESVKLY